MTLMLVIPVPGLLLFFAWRLLPLATREGLAAGLVNGLAATALSYFLLRLLGELCRPKGLGEAHFGWPETSTRKLRTGVRMLTVVGLPLITVAAITKGLDAEHGCDVVERGALLILAAILVVFAGRQFSPKDGVLKEYLAYHPSSWLARLRHVWYWGLLTAPAVVAGLSLMGYHYTARQLAGRLYITFALICWWS